MGRKKKRYKIYFYYYQNIQMIFKSLLDKNSNEIVLLKTLETDLQKNIMNRNKLKLQIFENLAVKKEFEKLPRDTKVFKVMGPMLVKQDLLESYSDVCMRITYIKKEIKSLAKEEKSLDYSLRTIRKSIKIYNKPTKE